MKSLKEIKKIKIICGTIFAFLLCVAIITGTFFIIKKANNNGNDSDNESVVQYNVIFKIDESIYETKQVVAGQKIPRLESQPTKINYEFKGWYNGETEWNFDEDVVNLDIILTAKFEIITYNVTFKDNDSIICVEKAEIGNVVKKPTYSKLGYNIKWYNGETEWNFDNKITEDIVLTLKTEIIKYTAKFKVGEVVIATREFTIEDSEIKDIPEIPNRKGYNSHWKEYEIKAENIDIVAIYEAIKYKAIFVADKTIIATREFTIEDSEIKDEPEVPHKSGFVGAWEEYILNGEDILINAKYTLAEFDDDGFKILSTKNDLIQYISNVENYSKNARLYNNINFDGEEWVSLGNINNLYLAKFDGNGFTISNFKITSDSDYLGLFGNIKDAEISNLTIKDISVQAVGKYTGGLVGYADNSTIKNCHVYGEVKGKNNIGGLIGYSINSNISCCYSSVEIEGNTVAGGLIGYGDNITINDCYSNCNITLSENSYIYSGGLVARAKNSHISNSYFWGDFKLTAYDYEMASSVVNSVSAYAVVYAGGVVGKVENDISISGCFSLVNMNIKCSAIARPMNRLGMGSASAYIYVGGIIGNNISDLDIVNCYQYEGQVIKKNIDSTIMLQSNPNTRMNGTNTVANSTYGENSSLQSIRNFVCENWNGDIWNKYLDENPILK